MTTAKLASIYERCQRNEETGCLEWQGYRMWNGYGSLIIDGRRWQAHRAVYTMAVGEIPEELVIDHLCRVRHCVNPDHLEPVTCRENVLRGASGRLVTECTHGHTYTKANTYIRPDGRRSCRACRRDRARAARQAS